MTITPIGFFKGAVRAGQILMVAQAIAPTSGAGTVTLTYTGVSFGDAQIGDYLLVAVAALSSSVANRSINGVSIDGVQASYKANTYGASNSQSSAIFMGPATGNTTGTIVVVFNGIPARCFITVYRCRDIDPDPVDSFYAPAAPLTGDMLIPAGGIAAATSENNNQTAASTWTGLTKDPDNFSGSVAPQMAQGVASGAFAAIQNKLTTTATWATTSVPTIAGASFGPKGYYPPATLTYLGKGQQTATQASFTFPAFNLGSYSSGRVIYIAVSATSTVARSLQSIFVGGKPAIIVTPFAAASGWCNYNAVSLATDTTADIVVNFSANMVDCAIGVWTGNGYDADWVDAYTFVGTQITILTSTLRCMSVGSCRSSSLTPSWSAGLITRDQTTRDAFGDITGLGSSTGLIANAYYNRNDGGGSGAATFPRAAPITPTLELIGKQGIQATQSTPRTFSNFNYAGGNGLGTPSADRVIYVAVVSIHTNAHQITGVTLGGTAMTRITPTQSSGTPGAIYTLAVPTGTNGDIVVSYSAASDRCEIFVWLGRGYSADGYHGAWAANNPVLNLPAGGMAIGQNHDDQALSPRWTSGLGQMDNVAAGGGNGNAAGRINTKAGSVTLTGVFGQAYSCIHGASFEAGPTLPPPTATFIGKIESAVVATTIDYGNFTIPADGLLVVGGGVRSASALVASSVSIDGSAAEGVYPGVSNTTTSFFAVREVKAGSRNVQVTYSLAVAPHNSAIGVWLVTGYRNKTPIQFVQSGAASNTTASVTLDIPLSSTALYVIGRNNGGGQSETWSEATERAVSVSVSLDAHYADKVKTVSSWGNVETTTWSGTSQRVLCGLVIR